MAAGLLFLAGLYGSFFHYTRRKATTAQETFFSTLMIFVLVRGLADTEIYDFSLPLWAIVAFCSLLRAQPETEAPSREFRSDVRAV